MFELQLLVIYSTGAYLIFMCVRACCVCDGNGMNVSKQCTTTLSWFNRKRPNPNTFPVLLWGEHVLQQWHSHTQPCTARDAQQICSQKPDLEIKQLAYSYVIPQLSYQLYLSAMWVLEFRLEEACLLHITFLHNINPPTISNLEVSLNYSVELAWCIPWLSRLWSNSSWQIFICNHTSNLAEGVGKDNGIQ